MIYLDCAATTKPNHMVVDEIAGLMRSNWYNPSAISEQSRQVKLQMEEARQIIADYINCSSLEIIFTSGGSESNNLGIKGYYNNPDNKCFGVFCSYGEHPSVFNTIESHIQDGHYGRIIPITSGGQVDLDELEKELKRLTDVIICHPLVCLSFVNNELGSINDIKVISKIVHQYGGVLLVDAVQAFTHLDIDVEELGIDMMSVSFHKFGGVRGCGFLYVKEDIELYPLINGGHQEYNLRAGTEASYLITAMGHRVKSIQNQKLRQSNFDYFNKLIINKIKGIEGITINGNNTCSHIISACIDGVKASDLVTLLGTEGIIISAGSACSSGENVPSRILVSSGLTDEEATSTIRISFDENIYEQDIEIFIESLTRNIQILRELQMSEE